MLSSKNSGQMATTSSRFLVATLPLIKSSTWKQMNSLWDCERFEPRSHFKSRLSLIVWVNVVLNRTVVVDSD